MIDFANQPTPTQVRDYYMLLRAGGDHMPKEARWKTCHHFGISMADFDKCMARWKAAQDRKARSKRKQHEVKLKERPPLDRAQAMSDYHSMSDLPHNERVKNIAAYYGETTGRVYALVGYKPELRKEPQKPLYEPTPEQIASECEKIRNGTHEKYKAPKWSQKVTRVRAGLGDVNPVETLVCDMGVLNGRAGSWSVYE